MSKLSYFGRPWVVFDARKKEHREWFAQFQVRRSWGNCPVRFILNEGSGNLITQIQHELVDFYAQEEFHEPAF